MVRISSLESELELYKQSDVDLHAEIDKATKDSEYLAQKTAEQEEENLRLKNLIAIKEDQVHRLHSVFRERTEDVRRRAIRELE